MHALNLVPLPTMPYDERPESLPLDVDECKTALYMKRGNVTEAAELLKVPSFRLRNFVAKSAYLTALSKEFRAQLADKAEDVIWEGLHDEHERYTMARFVASSLGKERGFNQNSATKGNVQIGPISISWGDAPPSGPQIDGEVLDVE